MSIMLAPSVMTAVIGLGWFVYRLGASILDSPVAIGVAIIVGVLLGSMACFIEEIKEDPHHPYHASR